MPAASPTYRYLGDVPRVFPDLGLTLNPGDEITTADDANPDETLFVKVAKNAPAAPAFDADAFAAPAYSEVDAVQEEATPVPGPVPAADDAASG